MVDHILPHDQHYQQLCSEFQMPHRLLKLIKILPRLPNFSSRIITVQLQQ
jgi:hypothetical protein